MNSNAHDASVNSAGMPQPGTLVTSKLGMQLAYIPAGRFMMGSPESEPGRFEWEDRHQVTLTRGYYLGTTEVTQGEWQTVMGSNPGHFKGDAQLPVEMISWYDAVDFCSRLSQLDGTRYRLPTEAEWEYACRAGTTTPFNTGANITTNQAHYDGRYPYNGAPKGEYRAATMRVGTFAPNAWGLYDMHGNVCEWCADWFAPMTADAATDPTGPESGSTRVVRGGSWIYYARGLRSAHRRGVVPERRGQFLGFRVTRNAE